MRRILSAAGFSSIAMEPVELILDIAVARGLDAAVHGALSIGPVSRALDGQPPELIPAAANSIRAALAPLEQVNSVDAQRSDLDRDGFGLD